MAIVIDDPLGLKLVHLASLRGAVSLEQKGMKRSHRPSALTVAKREFNLSPRASYDLAIATLTEAIEEIYNQRKGN